MHALTWNRAEHLGPIEHLESYEADYPTEVSEARMELVTDLWAPICEDQPQWRNRLQTMKLIARFRISMLVLFGLAAFWLGQVVGW